MEHTFFIKEQFIGSGSNSEQGCAKDFCARLVDGTF